MPFPFLTLAGLAGTAIANGISARKANKVNQKNYEEVRNYNTPRLQMGRFRAAGLNPNLIYTQTNEAEQRPEWRPPQYDFSSLGSSASSELSSYQNIKESRSRVDNLQKQNRLLDEQITSQVLQNEYQGLVNKNYQDLTDLQKNELKGKINQLNKAIEQMNAAIKLATKQAEDISKQWSFKSRELSLQNARLVLDRLQYNRQFQLALKEFGLKNKQFTEMVRQFEVDHQFQNYMLEFLKGLTGNENPKEAAKNFGAMIKAYISGNLGDANQFDHSSNQIEDARKRGIPYRRNGHWVRPWDNGY
jgi:hypothetical protein